MRKLDELQVLEPCHADWDQFAGGDKVRFCSTCGKNVLRVATLERRSRRQGIGDAGPDRCGIASSDQSLLRDRWLAVVQWPPPFARSSACLSVPCGL